MISLVLGVSKDGFIARKQDDDLKWLGTVDKALFKLLTIPTSVCFAGSKTAEHLPELPNRTVYRMTRSPQTVKDIQIANIHKYSNESRLFVNDKYTDAVCIGGQILAKELLEFGAIDQAFICHSSRYCFDGIKWELQNQLEPMFVADIKIDDVNIKFYKRK